MLMVINYWRQKCLQKFGRQAGLLTFHVDGPACLYLRKLYVGNPACLQTFLEAFPPPVREGVILFKYFKILH